MLVNFQRPSSAEVGNGILQRLSETAQASAGLVEDPGTAGTLT